MKILNGEQILFVRLKEALLCGSGFLMSLIIVTKWINNAINNGGQTLFVRLKEALLCGSARSWLVRVRRWPDNRAVLPKCENIRKYEKM